MADPALAPLGSDGVEEALATAPLTSTHVLLIVSCFLISVVDGFDVAAVSFALPSLAPEFSLSATQKGTLLSAGLIGAVLGAFIVARLEQAVGRRIVFIAALIWFAIGSLATIWASTYHELLIVRAVTGIGLGVPIPLLMATVGDSIPGPIRARVYSLLVGGVPVGGLLVSLTSVQLVPLYGWHVIFWVGFILPLMVVPIAFLTLSEAPARILASNLPFDRKRSALMRFGLPADLAERRFASVARTAQSHSLTSSLFTAGRAATTVPIILAVFLASLLLYFLINWIPSLMSAGAGGVQRGAVGGGVLNAGMIVATLCFGYLIDKFGVARVVPLGFVVSAPLVFSLGFESFLQVVGFIPLFLAGIFTMGSQLGCSVMVVERFSADIRTSASALVFIAARAGAICGPFIVGLLLSADISKQAIFGLAAAVAIVAAVAALAAAKAPRIMSTREAMQPAAA